MRLSKQPSNYHPRLTLISVKHLYTDVSLILVAGFLLTTISAFLFPSANPLFFLTAPVDNTSAACTPAAGDACGDYTSALTLLTSGRIDFPLLASESGRVSSSTLTAWVATDNPVGYSLSISSSAMHGGTDGNLTNRNNAITGRTDALVPIADPNTSAPATIESPTTFSSANCNAWGFALAKPQATGIVSGWNDAYSTQTNLLTTDTTYNIYRYSAVPAGSSNAATIKNTNSATGAGTSGRGDETNLYFAACAGGTGGALSEGVYQGNITLTATVNALPNPTIASISPTSGSTSGGDTITITGTGFGSSSNPYLTAAYLGGSQADNWASGLACQNLTITSNTQATCTTPAGAAGVVDVSVKSASGWYSKTGGWTYEKPIPTGPTIMQNITNATCSTVLSRAYDYRDNHSYWVQKLADGKCWMLTNLAYAGDGDTTYNDTTTLTSIVGSSNAASNYTDKQVITGITGSNPASGYTTEPTDPNTTTGANGQYGYLYNWCAAMGGQSAACQQANTQPNQGVNAGSGANNNLNICPKGWRLPTGGSGGEFQALNTSVNSGSTSSDSGLRSTWLGVYSGYYGSGLSYQGSYGNYWSSTVNNANYAYYLSFGSSGVNPTNYYNGKSYGFAVRCVAD